MKGIKDRGLFKINIKKLLFTSDDVMKILLADTEDTNMGTAQRKQLFDDHVKSHLFIDDTLSDKGAYIFFDCDIPAFYAQTKKCRIVVYCVCSRDLLDDFKMEGFVGNRADCLSQAIEAALLNPVAEKEFGIGDLTLEGVDIYNSKEHYGTIMVFETECFR
jgi:hypothetical protein